MKNDISADFNFKSLFGFALPTIVMMIFMSLYTMVDGIFAMRFVGANAMSAINVAFPYVGFVGAVGLMMGAGGSAVIARKFGEGRDKEARQDFGAVTVLSLAASVILAALGIVFLPQIVKLLGANEVLAPYCRQYLLILLAGAPLFMLQILFQYFFITAGKPRLGLVATVGAGVTNLVFDFVFMGLLDMGITGAAVATVMGYTVPSVIGLVFFFSRRGNLYFARIRFNRGTVPQTVFNGASEFASNIAGSVIAIMFNVIMIRLEGEDGVAAITIVLYSQFLFSAFFLGFSSGVAPVFSYNFGAGNVDRLKLLRKKCLIFIALASLVTFAVPEIFANLLVRLFTAADTVIYNLAVRGFRIFSLCYLFCGFNIYASSLFTALSDGKRSAAVSVLRTFIFLAPALLLLPLWLKTDGLWLATAIAEALAFIFAAFLVYRNRERMLRPR